MLIARDKEKMQLKDAYDDVRSRFIAVYGRRRIGKTFLVRETFEGKFTFSHSGLSGDNFSQQLTGFYDSLLDAGLSAGSRPGNWIDAFRLLKQLIRESKDKRKLIFIDELSWIETRKSDLMIALESFWNGWASARKDIVLIKEQQIYDIEFSRANIDIEGM